ncbi:hypothetical protein [uncultured Chitinophaga sp.]|uniref:hypothetical protein n=1 Tax=uncultured Chitinophaga sp. TaxID=339340 RepID=UPI0025F1148D|nr:hypothetical protein [uncultured Chitinophaga sp.]
MIQEEFDRLKGIVITPEVKLQFDTKPGKSSSSLRKSGTVVINIPQLQRIISQAGIQFDLPIVRLLLAHELAHQEQYRVYPVPLHTLLGECQADVIAGYFLFVLSNSDFFKAKTALKVNSASDPLIRPYFESLNNQTFALYSAIFNIGDNYSVENTHPRSFERRMAFRDGYTYGLLSLAEQNAGDPAVSSNVRQSALVLIKKYKKTLNVFSDDTRFSWSLRQAGKIVHTQLSNCRDIVVSNKWEYHTNSDNPYVSYTQNIRNTGDRTVTVNYLNYVYERLATDPENSLYWTTLNAEPLSVTLHPGESKVMTGRLNWPPVPMLPLYVPIGSTNSLYSCSCLGDNEARQTVGSDDMASETPTKKLSGANAFYILVSQRKALQDIIAGVGQPSSTDQNMITFESKLQYPEAKTTEVRKNVSTGQYSFFATLYKGADAGGAQHAVKKMLADLAELETPITPVRGPIPGWTIKDQHGVNIGYIGNMEVDDMDRYIVVLCIYNK